MSSSSLPARGVIATRYELLRKIGQGAIGQVFEARDLEADRPCAVKLLSSPAVNRDDEVVRRFLREARACSLIGSEHVVEVFDSGIDPVSGAPFMAMELLNGSDLEKVLKRSAPLEPSVAARLALQAATGVAQAHQNGILHRDLKPANLFLAVAESGEVTVKVLDFGIAKVRGPSSLTSSGTLTRTGRVIGTPLYMSPEQIRAVEDLDSRTDVWSLGVVLFEMLSGSAPFARQSSLADLMVAILTAELPLLQTVAPWVEPGFADVTHRAMSRALPLRYENGDALRAALAALVPGGHRVEQHELRCVDSQRRVQVAPRFAVGSTELGHMTVAVPGMGTGPRPRRDLPVVAVAGALGVIAALGFVTVEALRNRPQPPIVATARPVPPPPRPTVEPAETRSFLVRVPKGASVVLDGNPVRVTDGQITIHGAIGETFAVKLTQGGRAAEVRVAIAAQGAVPDSLDFPPRDIPTGPPGPPPVYGRAGAPAVPEDTPAAPASAEIELTDRMDEFSRSQGAVPSAQP